MINPSTGQTFTFGEMFGFAMNFCSQYTIPTQDNVYCYPLTVKGSPACVCLCVCLCGRFPPNCIHSVVRMPVLASGGYSKRGCPSIPQDSFRR